MQSLIHQHRTRANTSGTGGNYLGQQRVLKCFNCQGEGHMARQCPNPKRKKDATWFKEKVLLVEAQGNEGLLIQSVITHNEASQADNLDAYDSDRDEISTAKAVLMANLSSYGPDVLSEYLIESQNAAVQDTNSSAQQDALILSMFEQPSNQKKNAQFADFEKEINNLKQTLSEQSKEKELSTKTFNVFKNESKEKEAKNIDTEIALEKKVKELDNIIYKMGQSAQIEAPRELSKITPNALTEREWGFEHTKAIFQNEIIPFLKSLQDIFNVFDKDLSNEERKLLSNAATIAPGMYKLDLVILAPKVKNNREAHEYYLKHTMEQAAILREVVEQAKSRNPLDSASYSACMYVKLIQELLGYVRDTCPDIHKPSEKLVAVTPINKKKTVRFADTAASSSNMPKVTNRPLLSSTGVKPSTSASGSKPSGNTKNDRISRTPSSNEKNKVEVQSRKVKSKLNKQNSDSKNVCNEHVKHPVKGAQALCSVCNECLFDANHAMCLIDHVNSMNVRDKSASKKNKKRKEWKPTRKVFNSVGYKWKPTGRTFTLVGNACPLTRITATNKVPLRVPIPLEVVAPEHVVTRVYIRRPKVPKSVPNSKTKVVQIVLWYLDSSCSKHMTGDRSQLTNFVHKFLGTIKFGNDQVAKIMGYGDYQIGNVTILRVYYVEGLGHNLFSIGQLCDSDLEVAFRKHTCFVCNLESVNLLSGSRGTNLYSLFIGDMMASSLICLLLKSTKTKSWLWHRHLYHLNFDAINHLARHGLVRGLLRLKFEKDHLCSACAMGKRKKQSHKPKSEDINQVKLYLLHIDLSSKDEAPDFIIKFLKMIQVRLNAAVRNIRTDNGTEFINQTLRDYYEQVGISYETSIAQTLQQNGVVERRNCTLVEAARTMLIYVKAPYFNGPKQLLSHLTAIASEQNSLEPALYEMTLATLSLGLIPNPPPSAPLIPPSRYEWDLVFQPVFDELFSPLASVTSPVLIEEATAPVKSTGLPSSTIVDQDAPSPSTSQTTPQSQSQTIPLYAEEESHDLEVAYMSNNPYFGIPIPETISEESSSLNVNSITVHSDTPISEHLSKWIKDHPLQNIIGDPSRPVSTRLKLYEKALFCYYDAFLTSVEPNTYKDALTQSCCIQRISLRGFPAQSVGSSNINVLDPPCLLVLITGTSQSRQHGLFVTTCELYGVQQEYLDIFKTAVVPTDAIDQMVKPILQVTKLVKPAMDTPIEDV
ncbi:retrovirus-related pol polyprotein from transposon TNT 1-94 [Tanacetum coccineum]|uniref:Retrovirus-related pol polyprotein from transposon TNT 1-94 n=1 Tax=Tanacetum coccineum TaxID=301880 RepID=A0ABQ5FHE7_9ASTR